MVFVLALAGSGTQAVIAQDEKNTAALRFFEQRVRPLLVDRCFKCHSGAKHRGGLRLDTQSGIVRGGDSGPAIVPGDPQASLLIAAVSYRSLEMPPDRRLSDQEVQVLSQWIRMGAQWPSEDGGAPAPRPAKWQITEEDRNFWSFQPLQRPPVPNAPETDWDDDNPVDGFILRQLRDNGLQPSPPATQREFVRRVHFALIGLPPTPAALHAFAADDSPAAVSRLIEQLLARPQYGERWARHWLDLVRFAQTNGYERDDEKPFAWRYRDYVVRAFNDDKPFDRFVVDQLAGDEIPNISHDSIVATGFYRLGVWDDEPDDKQAAQYEELDDILRTTSETFLGLTIACARCHDHKFDPIPQADYYRLLAFFRNLQPYGKDKSQTHWELDPSAVFTPLATPQSLERWRTARQAIERQIAKTKERLGVADAATRKQLDQNLEELEKQLSEPPFPKALSAREPGTQSPSTTVLIRGSHLTPGKQVEPGFLSVFASSHALTDVEPQVESSELHDTLRALGVKPTSGRRRVLAEWIASSEQPLTARVIVNRLWHYHFGRGIVATPNDFGHTGQRPSHPQLLDWLASELISHHWSLKHVQRLILTSRTYRQSSAAWPTQDLSRHSTTSDANESPSRADPENRLLWRQNLRRLDAEAIRDSLLATSGQLNLEMGGRGFFPKLSANVLASQSRPGNGWGESDDWQRSRRSLYMYLKRTLGVPMMEALDLPVPDKPEPARQTTTIAPQALILMNNDFVDHQAKALATRLLRTTDGSDAACIDRVFWLALSRSPSPDERRTLAAFCRRQRLAAKESGRANSDQQAQRLAVIELSRLVFNLNEFVYLD